MAWIIIIKVYIVLIENRLVLWYINRSIFKRGEILEKHRTKELVFSLILILVGILFWVVKIRYFTYFFFPLDHFLNKFGYEIIGTILILIGVIIIKRIYPFVYSIVAEILVYIILILNILEFFLHNFEIFKEIIAFLPFIMSLELFFVSKILETGLRYFGNIDLSKKWKYFSVIIFFGFSLPYYLLTSLSLCGLIKYEGFKFTKKMIGLFTPLVIVLLFFFLYYLHYLIKSLQFLLKISKKRKGE